MAAGGADVAAAGRKDCGARNADCGVDLEPRKRWIRQKGDREYDEERARREQGGG